jgi:uncharacterized protein YfbU (UPF0304 family)
MELKGGWDGDNSHAPMMDTYRKKLAAWKESADRHEPTREDLERISKA